MASTTRGQSLLQKAVTPKIKAAKLAEKLGVTSQAVSAWVRGEAKPEPLHMAKLEDLLGIPMRSWLDPDESADDLPAVAPTGTEDA